MAIPTNLCNACGADATQEAQFKTITLIDRDKWVRKDDTYNSTGKFDLCDSCSSKIFSTVMEMSGLLEETQYE